jgi:16S rRNA (cytosine967-C5)-methyltransferase
MNRSTKTRYVIFQILLEIFKKNRNFEIVFNKIIAEFRFNQKEISFINNVCLNSMRRSIHCKIILNKFTKKKIKTNEFILLVSAIVQIVYLNIKPYAVVNETVNVSKKINVYPGFINAVLKNILKNINDVKKTQIKLTDFPKWFINEIGQTKNINLNYFIDTFYKQPGLHLVFKSEAYLNNFKEQHTKSSKQSAFIEIQKKIIDIYNYKKGEWWVQDFSSMLPLAINSGIKDLDILDICAAPGGKAFQILSNNKVVLNDINKKRISKLKDNLSRLGFCAEIKNLDALDFDENYKYDIVLVDSPCSSIGTIRKNPEILFRSKKPNFKSLNELQNNLLLKSSRLVKNKGKIIYMVCSFFHSETTEVIKKFLRENKNFSIERYSSNIDILNIANLISKEGYFLTIPTENKGNYIDGFFSVQLIRND